ncbi:MAG: molybdopterin converting factor subunit 1 [Opitutales bacterium]
MSDRRIKLRYFASLRESAGTDCEELLTEASTPRELYVELRNKKNFSLHEDELRVAINGEFGQMDEALDDGDEIAFIPPVSGG